MLTNVIRRLLCIVETKITAIHAIEIQYEIVAYLIDVSKRFIILDQHLGKLRSLLRIDAHDASQQEDVIRNVAHFLGIQDNLLDLTSFRKALDHLKISRLRKVISENSLRNANCLKS